MLDDIASVTLSTALSALAQRQRVSANNIANLETPNFSASTVSFEDSLRAAVAAGDPASAQVTVTPTGETPGINGNNVSLGDEMVTATKTGLQEKLVMGGITAKYELISTVLKG